jgi:hypothetical protein
MRQRTRLSGKWWMGEGWSGDGKMKMLMLETCRQTFKSRKPTATTLDSLPPATFAFGTGRIVGSVNLRFVLSKEI